MRLRCSAALAWIAAASMVACHREEPLSASRLAGCWAFERQDGVALPLGAEMPDTLMLDSAAQLNPDGQPHPFFPLRATVVSHRPGTWLDSIRLDSQHVVPWPPDWKGYYSMVAWRFDAPDSVHITLFVNMSGGWELRLMARGDSLVGRAIADSDVLAETLHPIPIVARRVACGRLVGLKPRMGRSVDLALTASLYERLGAMSR